MCPSPLSFGVRCFVMKFGESEYEFVVASDVIRDGLGMEAWRTEGDDRVQVVLEAFRSDITGEITFSAYEEDLPFALIDRFVAAARERLTTDASN